MPVRNSGLPQVIQVVGGAPTSIPQAINAISQIDPVSSTINMLNANPYLIGVFYLFLNLGGRFISMELTKKQEMFLANPILRPFILFCVMFISTRNLAVAFWTTIGILAVLRVFANENSPFCLVPGWRETPINADAKDLYNITMDKINKIPHEAPEDNHEAAPGQIQQTVTEEHNSIQEKYEDF
jgi:hypothetical protein